MEVGDAGAARSLQLPFHDRRDAGRILAGALRAYRNRPGTVVLGMERGGVVPAAEIARALGLPLDVVVSRKLCAPGNPEFAIGALAEGGSPCLDEDAMRHTGASSEYVASEITRQRGEIARRQRRFRAGRPLSLPERATVILVDDGVATGSTAIAAIRALRLRGVACLIFAAPVAPPSPTAVLRGLVDELVVLTMPRHFHSVGFFYDDFAPVADDEVVTILERTGARQGEGHPDPTEERHAVA